MWFGWNRFGFGGPWGFGPMYGMPYYYGPGFGPYGSGYAPGMYGAAQYGGYDPRTMELMAMREELEFMSQRVDEILKRLDEIEREMR